MLVQRTMHELRTEAIAQGVCRAVIRSSQACRPGSTGHQIQFMQHMHRQYRSSQACRPSMLRSTVYAHVKQEMQAVQSEASIFGRRTSVTSGHALGNTHTSRLLDRQAASAGGSAAENSKLPGQTQHPGPNPCGASLPFVSAPPPAALACSYYITKQMHFSGPPSLPTADSAPSAGGTTLNAFEGVSDSDPSMTPLLQQLSSSYQGGNPDCPDRGGRD
jgi:hypothetical protein